MEWINKAVKNFRLVRHLRQLSTKLTEPIQPDPQSPLAEQEVVIWDKSVASLFEHRIRICNDKKFNGSSQGAFEQRDSGLRFYGLVKADKPQEMVHTPFVSLFIDVSSKVSDGTFLRRLQRPRNQSQRRREGVQL